MHVRRFSTFSAVKTNVPLHTISNQNLTSNTSNTSSTSGISSTRSTTGTSMMRGGCCCRSRSAYQQGFRDGCRQGYQQGFRDGYRQGSNNGCSFGNSRFTANNSTTNTNMNNADDFFLF